VQNLANTIPDLNKLCYEIVYIMSTVNPLIALFNLLGYDENKSTTYTSTVTFTDGKKEAQFQRTNGKVFMAELEENDQDKVKLSFYKTKLDNYNRVKDGDIILSIENIPKDNNSYQINFFDLTVNGNGKEKGVTWKVPSTASGGGKKDRRSYASRTLKELQILAKSRGLTYSGLKKEALVNKLRGKK